MKCKICGSELKPGDTVCHVCGVVVDYHDYTNSSFSSAEDRINNNLLNNTSNNDNSSYPANDNFSFFSNKSSNSQSSSSSSNDKNKYLIAVVITLILLFGFGVVLVKVLTPEPKAVEDDGDTIILGGDDSGTKEPDLPETPDEPEDPEKPIEPEKEYKYFEGYKFEVLEGYTVEQQQESLIFNSTTDNIQFVLSIYHSNPFSIYLKRKDEVKTQWEERYYVISNYGEKMVGNSNWLVLNSTYNEKPFSIVYREFFNNGTLELLILNSGSLTDDEAYNKIETMLSTVTIDSTTTSETNNKA